MARGRLRLGEEDNDEDFEQSQATTANTSSITVTKTSSHVDGIKDVPPSSSDSLGGQPNLINREENDAPITATSSSTATSSTAKVPKGTTKQQDQQATNPPKKKSKSHQLFNSNLFLKFSKPLHLLYDVQEHAVGIGQADSIPKYGVGESIGWNNGEITEDDYGIAVRPERFHDIVTGLDPSRYVNSSAAANQGLGHGGTGGKIGDDVLRRGLGFGSDGRPVLGGSGGTTAVPGRKRGATNYSDGNDLNLVENEDDEEDEQAIEALDLSDGKGILRGRNGRPHIKVSTVPRRLEILAEIGYVPLEGRVNARAARQSARRLQPRQVVILGGGPPPTLLEEDGKRANAKKSFVSNQPSSKNNSDSLASTAIAGEVRLLADAVREKTIGGEVGAGVSYGAHKQNTAGSVFTPADEETVELRVGHAAYSARLIDTPYVSRADREAGKKAVAAISDDATSTLQSNYDLIEVKVGKYTVSQIDCIATGKRLAIDGSVVLAPRARLVNDHGDSKLLKQHHRLNTLMLSDKDVLLTDLRSDLIACGHKVEYKTHFGGYQQLIINGKIIVRKNQISGKLHVEGPLCEDFYAVRNIVCSKYVTL